MEKITKEYEVFTFDELSEEAKETVINKLGESNVDSDWWKNV